MSIITIDPNDPKKSPGYYQISRFLSMSFREAMASKSSSLRETKRNPKSDPILNRDYNTGDIDLGDLYDMNLGTIHSALGGDGIRTTQEHVEDYKLIEKVLFGDLGLNKSKMTLMEYKSGMILLPGDVLLLEVLPSNRGSVTLSFYSVVISHKDKSLFSFPEISYGKTLNHVRYLFRPTDITGNYDLLGRLKDAVGDLVEFPENQEATGQINVGTQTDEPNGLLQIGDIKFMVSPTQISFVTQNGYQQFPTIRTRGDPKLPTMQEVKSVHINLIFPNEDNINNQLLPLYAMFRRSPFVNLYNKDICAFFSELRGPASKYIPIALDSISVESVAGFPNTLQATINIFPFQHRGVGDSFKALKTYVDVRAQQWFQDDKSDAILTDTLRKRLYSPKSTARLPHMIKPVINATYNFEESEPFRAFYQALIAERKEVEDSVGNTVYKSGSKKGISLETFRPTKEENKLHYYVTDHNINKSIKFHYTYIPDDIRKFSAKRADAKDKSLFRIAQDTKNMMNIMTNTDLPEFRDKINNAFINRQTFYDQTKSKLMSAQSVLRDYFSIHNIDIGQEPAGEITNLLQLLLESAKSSKLGTLNAAVEAIKSITGGGATVRKRDDDILGILRGISVYAEGRGPVTPEALSNIIGLRIQEVLGRTATSYKVKERWAGFFATFFEALDGKLVDEKLSSMKVSNIPIEEDDVIIDNKNDVIEGWSVNFANKFIPVNLEGFKYPFYQHVGSDDINMALSIKSIQGGRDKGLKDQLSELNDRIQNSTKVVLYHAPELITDLDPRIRIDLNADVYGSIFNMFNIRRAVFNGSNVTNVPGQPDTWRINVNLTQANFTVRDYQNVQSIPNFTNIQDEIINLLSRCSVDEGGNIKVYNYTVNVSMLEELKNDSVQPVDESNLSTDPKNRDRLYIYGDPTKSHAYGGSKATPVVGEELKKLNVDINSFAFYYTQWLKIVQEASSKDVADSSAVFNLVNKNVINREKSDSETKRLNSIIKDKPELRLIIKSVVARINQLHITHADLLAKLFKKEESFLSRVNNRVTPASFGYLMAGIVLFGIFSGPIGWLVTAVAVGLISTALIDIIGVPAFDVATEKQRKKLASTYQSTIEGIINGIKYSFIDKIANDIIRDPLVRKELFGDKYERLIQGGYLNKGVNCYNDFDLPVGYRKEQSRYHQTKLGEQDDLVGLIFSPDFYLYNYDISKLEKEFYANSSIVQLKNIAKTANMLTLRENYDTLEQINILDKTIFNGEVDEVRTKLLNDLEVSTIASNDTSSENITNKLTKLQRLYTKIATNRKAAADAENPDHLKFNLIRAARNKRLVQLKILQTAVNLSLAGYGDTVDNNSPFKITIPNTVLESLKNSKLAEMVGVSSTDDIIKGSLLDASLDSVKKMSRDIDEYFIQYIQEDKKGSIGKKAKEQKLISKPGSRKFEESVYILINQLILLGTAIRDYEQGAREFDYLHEIPEVKMLEWFNWRLHEDANSNRISLLNQFVEQDVNNSRGSNAKMFPTFKLFFVEEDGKTIKNMDDYYSYNAINSLDIVSNKNSASKTAIIRLSNTMGHLTDKVSLLRESDSTFERITKNADNIFLGTLDIKPGTKVIIKMGYHANDRFLKTVFVGRIIEMNPGPDVTMVCQSYGAQLNHHITKMNFGIRSTANEHGDIAATVLDAIPSLEGFGKPSLLNLNADKFTGKNLRQLDKNLFEKFMVSNLLNRVNAGMFTQDNPRDNNLYLPFSLFPSSLDKMTFDWRVYDQSAWDVLQELSLYHRNTRPTVKFYNDDIYSTMDDLRESVVIGDKAGYYKYTDSFALSSMRVKEISVAVESWNRGVREKIGNILFLTSKLPIIQDFHVDDFLNVLVDNGYLRKEGSGPWYYYAQPRMLDVVNFLRKRLHLTVLVKKILDSTNGIVPKTISGYSIEHIRNLFPGIKDKPHEKLIKALMELSNVGDMVDIRYEELEMAQIKVKKILGVNVRQTGAQLSPTLNFLLFLHNNKFDDYFSLGSILAELSVDDLLNVDELITDNNATALVNNPQYKKIQKHHLITDMSDIISNNIILSEDFKNAVSVYYLPEPKFYSGLSGIDHKDVTKLKSWTIKSFGDLRDGDTRLLESYQKNIDTNWWDIRSDTEHLLRSYARKKMEDFSDVKDPTWDKLPTFVITSLSLLQREVEKMYRGTIQIVGNPSIEPFDIVHINDTLNDMHGPVEVEEVIHSFSPDRGFVTTITPSLITYDRDPVTLSDVETIGRVMDVADMKRNRARMHAVVKGIASLGIATVGFRALSSTNLLAKGVGGLTGGVGGLGVLGAIYDGTIGIEKRYTQFIYDSLANVFGRDCINFSALFYHGVPYMCGFDGVDYTNLKTLINHQWQGQTTIQRLATAKDVEYKWMINHGDLSLPGPIKTLIADYTPGNGLLWDVIVGSQFGKK